MEFINLNINDYTDNELEDIFCLEYPYNSDDIKKKQQDMYNNLIQDNSVEIKTKSGIHDFLTKVSNRLEQSITNTINNHISNQDNKYKFNGLQNTVNQVNSNFIIVKEQDTKEAYNLPPSKGLNIGNDGGAPPGIINPIKYRTIKKAVNIDSKFRPNYYQSSASDQQLTLPYKFENVINMRLASIELPLTFYSISHGQGNNCLRIDWDLSGQTINNENPKPFNNSVIVQVPDGNYNTFISTQHLGHGGSIIETTMNAALNASIKIPGIGTNTINPSQKTIQEDSNFNIKYTVDSTSGRSIFALDISGISQTDLTNLINNNSLAYQITFGVNSEGIPRYNEPLPLFLGWQLGYRVIQYYSGPGTINGNNILLPASIVSEGICYPKGPSYIFVAIDDYNNNVNNYYVSAYSDSINNRNILARINVSSIVQKNGCYQTGEDDGFSTQINRSRQYFGPVNIEKLRITLYDEYGRQIVLNNMDWSCALMFECMYS